MTTTDTKSVILVPLDGSELAEQAIPFAQSLAGSDGKLTLLVVAPDAGEIRGLWGNVITSTEDVVAMERTYGQKIIEEAAERWQSTIGDVQLEVRTGDPADQIVATANAIDASMIVMSSHGRGAVGRFAYGSVTDAVTRTSTVPVMIVHPGTVAAAEITRILVPVDGSELAMEALPVAINLAKATGAKVHLVQAISPSAIIMPSPVDGGYYPPELIDEIEQELITEATTSNAAAEQVVIRAEVPVTTSIVEGPAGAVIANEAHAGDVIVMTSHGRGGFKRWLLGSTAEKLVRAGVAPVVLVPSSTRNSSEPSSQ